MLKLTQRARLAAALVVFGGALAVPAAGAAEAMLPCTCAEAAELQNHATGHCQEFNGPTWCAELTYCDTWFEGETQYFYYEANCYESPSGCTGIGGGC